MLKKRAFLTSAIDGTAFAALFSAFLCCVILTGCQKPSSPALYGIETASPGPGAADSDKADPPAPSPEPGTTDPASSAAPSPSPTPSPPPKLVEYDGLIENIFLHPLVVYPELAFDGDSMSQGYDDWFVTVPEFNKIIESIYEKGYILIDINSLVGPDSGPDKTDKPDETDKADKTDKTDKTPGAGVSIARKPLMVPEGKKPLVLSVDDLNYYEYMRQDGNNYNLILDQNGDVAAYSKDPAGNDVVSRDNEVVTIVDDFVRRHPDFSLDGAKGVICETGYEGVLGYRTDQPDSPSYVQDKADALKVVSRLKATGWSFSSHSYYHKHLDKLSYAGFTEDTDRWLKEVEPIIGPTRVFMYPFGAYVDSDTPKFNYLEQNGFRIYCGVGIKVYNRWTPDHLYMDRTNIDGYSMRNHKAELARFFDADSVIDLNARTAYLKKK